MSVSGWRYWSRPASARPGCRRRASTSSSTSAAHDWPTPSSSQRPRCRRRAPADAAVTTSRGSSIRRAHRRHHRRRGQQVGLHPARHRQLRAPARATRAPTSARAGSPRGSISPVSVIHDVVVMPANASVGAEGRRRPPAGHHHLAPANPHRDRRVGQRRRVEHHEPVRGAVGESGAGQAPRQVQHEHRRFGERAHLGASACAAADLERQRAGRRAGPTR